MYEFGDGLIQLLQAREMQHNTHFRQDYLNISAHLRSVGTERVMF